MNPEPKPSFLERAKVILWKDDRRRMLTVTGGMLVTSWILFLWLPFRVWALQTLISFGGSRFFIGVEYSPLDGPRYSSFPSDSGAVAFDPGAEVLGLERNGESKAIPVKSLAWNLVLNDVVGQEPVLVALCTVADAAMAFRATVAGRVLRFRPIGLNRNNLVLQDLETGSRWQQFTGRAISGPLSGATLERIPLERVSLKSWRAGHPKSLILEPPGKGMETTVPHDTCPIMSHFHDEPFLLEQPGNEDSRLGRKRLVTGVVRSDGSAVACPLGEESSLPECPSVWCGRCYWFAWSEFHPDTELTGVHGNGAEGLGMEKMQ